MLDVTITQNHMVTILVQKKVNLALITAALGAKDSKIQQVSWA